MVQIYPRMICSRALAASVILMSLPCIAIRAIEIPPCVDELVSRPDVVRTTDGSNALFRWETRQNVSDYYRIECQYQHTSVVVFSSTPPQPYAIVSDQYRNRTTGWILENIFGFNLTWVAGNDSVGNYTMTLYRGGTACDAKSFLYLYRPPTKPVLQISKPGTRSEGYNVTCLANVTSVPPEYRLPVVYTWSVRDQDKQLNEYTLTGEQNGTLSLFSPDVTKNHIIDVKCVAREEGSPLSSNTSNHIFIPKSVYNSIVAPGKDSDGGDSTLVIIVASVTGSIVCAMAFIVGYLCWERKHKPGRSRRRTQLIRQSLAIPRLRHGRSNQAFTSDSDQEIYNSIRNSAIMSTIDTDIVPTLPKRPPGLEATATGKQGVYDYADPLRLALRAINHPQDAKEMLPNDKDYPEDVKYGPSADINNAIQKDVDLYMGDVTDGKVLAPTDVSVAYNAVNKDRGSILGDDDDTAVLDNMAYHSVAKEGSQPISATAPSNVPPPESSVKRNSYVASPTGKKRTESKTKVRQRDSATRENTASVQSNVANANSELNTPEPDLYFLAQSLVDHHARPAGTGGTVGTPEGILQADCTLSDVQRPRAGSSHVSENTVSSNVHRWSSISGDDDTALLDNMAYHSVGKEGCQPTANTAPGNVAPPQSCVLRNSYVENPTLMFSNARQRMSSDDDHDLEIIDNESYVTSP